MKLKWRNKPGNDESDLVLRAVAHADELAAFYGNYGPSQYSDRHRLVMNMLRHEYTNYDALCDSAESPEQYLALCQSFFHLVTEAYPWLSDASGEWLRGKRSDVELARAMHEQDRLEGHWWAFTTEELKAQRQERSANSSAAIAGGQYNTGAVVKCWYGERFGVITKVNRVTVKVRHIGGKRDGYTMMEKNYQTEVIGPYSNVVPELVNTEVSLVDWQGKDRDAVVLEQNGPFILVRYAIKNGEEREVWTDFGRVSVEKIPA